MNKNVMAKELKLSILAKAELSEITVGRWCDEMIPAMPQFNRIMTIVIDGNGSVVLKSNFADGSSIFFALGEFSSGIYKKLNSTDGDKYRIKQNDGNLQLLDNDGLIRVAKRLENIPHSGECKCFDKEV